MLGSDGSGRHWPWEMAPVLPICPFLHCGEVQPGGPQVTDRGALTPLWAQHGTRPASRSPPAEPKLLLGRGPHGGVQCVLAGCVCRGVTAQVSQDGHFRWPLGWHWRSPLLRQRVASHGPVFRETVS